MSSSDSEDDYYCNAAKKLEKLKNKYQEDKINTSNLLNDSKEAEVLQRCSNPVPVTVNEVVTPLKPETSGDSSILDEIIAKNTKKRVTRSRAKQNAAAPVAPVTAAPETLPSASSVTTTSTTSRRGRKSSCCATSTPSPRARRGRRSRNRDFFANLFIPQARSNIDPNIPIYSVGNTYEYPDISHNQDLFSTKPKTDEIICVDADESIEENEELSVKVYWQSSEFFKFVVRKYQKFSHIFDYFSKKENVSHNNLLFTYNDTILKPDDTPDSINYSIVKYIDGGIVNENVSNLIVDKETTVKNGIKLKFQCQLVKKPFETVVGLDEKFGVVMMKYAEHIERPLNKLKFQFDGDVISGKSTPKDLELEGGECIDVNILS